MASKRFEFSPKRRLTLERIDAHDNETKLIKTILDHHFNFSVGILAPNLKADELSHCIPVSSMFAEFCCLVDMALTEFIHPEFIEKFVKKESILALSHQTRIDTSDCVALLPNGILFLSLTKDTYECLGIQGKPSPFANNLRFDVEINLLAPYCQPNKKYYERVKRGFQNIGLKLKFLMSTISDETTEGEKGGELSKYFKSHDISCERFSCTNKVEDCLNINIPLVKYDQPFLESTIDVECTGLLFHEWLGCMVCGVDCSSAAPDSFDNTLCCPKPCERSNAAFCKWTGFLTSKSVQNLVKIARKILRENPNLPWLTVLVWGFSDSPVSWRDRRHGYYMSGDNHYTLVLFPNDRMWIYSTLGDNDEQP